MKKRLVETLLLTVFFLSCTYTTELSKTDDKVISREYNIEDFKDLSVGVPSEDFTQYDAYNQKVTVVEEEEEIVTVSQWDEESYKTLAKIVYSECGGQGWTAMMYCGSVVLNRMENGYSWQNGDTVLEVWSRKGQYSTYKNRSNIVPSEEAYEVAEELLENGSILPSYVLYQSNGYTCEKYDGTVYEVINGEYFWY